MRYSYVTIARYIARVAINLTLKCKLQLVRTVCQSTRQRMNRMQQTLSDLAARLDSAGTRGRDGDRTQDCGRARDRTAIHWH